MGFESKMKKMEAVIHPNEIEITKEIVEPRISKSYTLKKNVANELTKRAKLEDLTASRFLEKLLKKEFDL